MVMMAVSLRLQSMIHRIALCEAFENSPAIPFSRFWLSFVDVFILLVHFHRLLLELQLRV
jgi:hypothetical protein